jgi:hypothetical protein
MRKFILGLVLSSTHGAFAANNLSCYNHQVFSRTPITLETRPNGDGIDVKAIPHYFDEVLRDYLLAKGLIKSEELVKTITLSINNCALQSADDLRLLSCFSTDSAVVRKIEITAGDYMDENVHSITVPIRGGSLVTQITESASLGIEGNISKYHMLTGSLYFQIYFSDTDLLNVPLNMEFYLDNNGVNSGSDCSTNKGLNG